VHAVRIDRRFLNWGVFFILLGAIPLLVQAGSIDTSAFARAWQLWPLLIIGAGVGVLLRRTPFDFVGGLVVAATSGLMFGSLLAVGSDIGALGGGCGNAGTPFQAEQAPLSNGTVNVQFNCGDLTVATAPGSAWMLSGSSKDGRLPRVDASATRLDARTPNDDVGFFGFGARNTWLLTLPQDPSLDVKVQLNAGTGTLGFGGAHLGALDIDANAGTTKIDLSETAITRLDVQVNAGSAKVSMPAATLTGSLQVNAGSIGFCVPEGTAVQVTAGENITGSNNFTEQGLVRTGNTWASPDYASATNRITLTASANAGSISMNPKEGCR